MLLATVVVILATLAQVAWIIARGRKGRHHAVGQPGAGHGIRRRDDLVPQRDLHQVEAHVLYWVMGLSFWLSQLVFANLLRALIGEQLNCRRRVAPAELHGVAFFAFMGLLNLYVAYSFSTDTWVNFQSCSAASA